MAKANNKTTENNDSVAAFVKKITDADRRKDCQAIIDIMEKQSGFPAKMWGSAIIGFGTYHYKYESGREGDAPLVGFSPRKTEFALYLSSEFDKRDELLKQFGKHKTAKACVYVKKLEDVNVDVLKKMISNSIKHTRAKYK
ncbi:MAG TPA: DUF1801 domain-containing protein [Ferruginibacter sp.]|jgi:hypothetical protein|nr:DUF1801 domain-containing protein [Ferruginibacter sp.]HNF42215.1 DUF1801 domain-containing protein [Ferruginibacter sp.]